MSQFVEFVGNHPMLFMAFAITLGFLAYTEFSRFTGVKSLSPYEATQLLNDGDAIFLDVRDDAEFKKGHVIDATNVPVSALDKRLHELEKYKSRDLSLIHI